MSTITYTLGGNYDPESFSVAQIKGFSFFPLDGSFVTIFPLFNNYSVLANFLPAGIIVQSDGVTPLSQTNAGYDFDFSDNVVSVNITGGNYSDIIRGGSGSDFLFGGGGNDVLEGGPGGDRLDGGSGVNTASYQHSTSSVTVDLAASFLNKGDAFGDTYKNIQNIVGGSGNDTLIGNDHRNVIEGGAGADKIIGGGGPDVASYIHSTSGVTVNLTNQFANSGGDAGGDILVGIENLTGSANADNLTGDDFANIIRGSGGADSLFGRGGNDRFIISSSPNIVDGGDGVDTLVIKAGASVSLSNANFVHVERTIVQDGARGDLSGVSGGERIYSQSESGSTAKTTIVGTQGADKIHAGGGLDDIAGSGGNDSIFAGTGIDTFHFDGAGFGRDVVHDASLASDTFEVSGLGSTLLDLHFQSSGPGGLDTKITNANNPHGDSIILKGVTASDAQNNGHFTFSA